MSQDPLPIVHPVSPTPPPSAGAMATAKPARATTDTAREACETFVFVVVLVMLLKLFVAEAFVIPTGSMAETLWGDQIEVGCRECGFRFPMNASVDSLADSTRNPLYHYTCPNCGFRIDDNPPINPAFDPRQSAVEREQLEVWKDHKRSWMDQLRIRFFGDDPTQSFPSSGDRVLVSKYDYHLHEPKRFDVPVFKYPEAPFQLKDKVAMNYIKRLVGLPGETIAVFGGDLYVATDLDYSWQKKATTPEQLNDAWKIEWTYQSDPTAIEHFQAGKFRILRKSPEEIMAVRRIVFDFDHQPKSLRDGDRTRWEASPNDGTGWKIADKSFSHSGDRGWVRYVHRTPGWGSSRQPETGIVTDNLGYNKSDPGFGPYWVPDLTVETEAAFASASSEVVLELNRGSRVFSAVFANGECQIGVRGSDEPFEKMQPLGAAPTKIATAGTYNLRLANVDSRLTVWVNNRPLELGKGADCSVPDPTQKQEASAADRDRAVRIGAKGDVVCSKVRIHRDIYYTCWPNCGSPVQTYYVQPDHILCFGDNSNSSSDGRSWGLVPKRMLLGRAVMVYWPYNRIGVIE